MAYEKTYVKPYPDGWKNLPEKTTCIDAAVLDQYDDTFEHIEEYLGGMDLTSYATTDYVDTKINEALGNILEGSS